MSRASKAALALAILAMTGAVVAVLLAIWTVGGDAGRWGGTAFVLFSLGMTSVGAFVASLEAES